MPLDPQQLDNLEWRQPAVFERYFELRSGGVLAGTLRFVKMFGSLAEGEAAGMRFTFKRSGFFSPRASARVAGTETDIAVFEPNWGGSRGLIRLAGGELLEFRAVSFFGSEWALRTPQNEELLRYSAKGILRQGASVQVAPAMRQRQDLALLLLLTWYILVLYMEDESSAAAVIATS